MRKILIFLGLLFVMLSGVYAQKGRQAIGFGLSYGTEIESIGLGLKYQYNITNPIRLEPSLNYFIENDNVSMVGHKYESPLFMSRRQKRKVISPIRFYIF